MVKQFGLPSYVIWIFAGVAFVTVGTLAVFEWAYGLAAFVLAGLVAYLGYRFFFRPAFIELDIMKSGEPATAIILESWDTGRKVNHHPRLGLKLEVRPPESVPYQVEILHNIKEEERKLFKQGRVISVKVDSRNPKKVAILPKAS